MDANNSSSHPSGGNLSAEQVQSSLWYKLDFFPYSASYRYPAVRRKKIGVVSVVLVAVLLAYVVATIVSWLNDLPDISNSPDEETDWSAIKAPGVYVYFSIHGQFEYNTSMYTASFSDNILRGRGLGGHTRRDLSAVECDGVLPPADLQKPSKFGPVLCPDPAVQNQPHPDFDTGAVYLQGSFDQQIYRYLQVDVELCCESPTVCAPHCQPWNVSLAHVERMDMNIIVDFDGDTLTPGNTAVESSTRYTFPGFADVRTDVFLSRVTVRESPKLLLFQAPSVVLEVQDRATYYKPLDPTRRSRYRVYYRLSPVSFTRQKTYKHVLALIGDWAATYTAMFGVVGFFIVAYKQQKFHEQLEGLDLRYFSRKDFTDIGVMKNSIGYHKRRTAELHKDWFERITHELDHNHQPIHKSTSLDSGTPKDASAASRSNGSKSKTFHASSRGADEASDAKEVWRDEDIPEVTLETDQREITINTRRKMQKRQELELGMSDSDDDNDRVAEDRVAEDSGAIELQRERTSSMD